MSKTRLEAFTDAVVAIVMTILVLELQTPESASFGGLWELRMQFFTYLVSFATLAIYWNNHHHLFQASTRVSGKVLWWNVALIFCLSLIPFTTAWMSEHASGRAPELLYGSVILATNLTWLCLARVLVQVNGPDSTIAQSMRTGGHRKSYLSVGVVAVGIAIGVAVPMAVLIACLLSLLPWAIPDQDIERRLNRA